MRNTQGFPPDPPSLPASSGPASDDALLNPPDPLSKGAIRAYRLSIAAMLSLPASSGPASDDALLILRSVLFRNVVPLLSQTLMLFAIC